MCTRILNNIIIFGFINMLVHYVIRLLFVAVGGGMENRRTDRILLCRQNVYEVEPPRKKKLNFFFTFYRESERDSSDEERVDIKNQFVF